MAIDREAIKARKKAEREAARKKSRAEIQDAYADEDETQKPSKKKGAKKAKQETIEDLVQGKPILIEVATLREVLVSISNNPGRQEEALRLAIERADENGIFSSMSDFCHAHCKHRLDHDDDETLPGACESCPIAGMALNQDELATLGLIEPSDETPEDKELSKRDRMRGIKRSGEEETGPTRRIRRGEIKTV